MMAEDEAFIDSNQRRIGERNHKLQQLKSFLCIDNDMIPMKIMYLLWGGLIGSFEIYLNAFFVSVGISKSKAGVLTGLCYVVFTLAGPVWGIITDYTGRQRLVVLVLCICSAGSISSLPLIANTLSPISNNEYANQSIVNTRRNYSVTNKSHTYPSVNNMENVVINTDVLFYALLGLILFGSMFFSCLGSFVESIALKTIKASPKGSSYGGQRIFGSIGASAIVYLMGILLDKVTMENFSPYAIVFFVYPIFPISIIPLLFYIIGQQDHWIKSKTIHCDVPCDDGKSKENDADDGRSIWAHLLDLFKTLDVIVLMITALVAGLAFCMIFFYIFLINEQMNVSKADISLVFSMQSISNIAMFPFTSMLMKLLRGPIPSIILGLFCFCVRHIVMAYTTTYWIMVVVQLLHAFSFALMWSALMEQVHTVSPDKIKVTMINIFQSVYFGLGASLCNMVGGILYEMSNARTLILWNGVGSGVWMCVLVLYYGLKYCIQKKKQGVCLHQDLHQTPYNDVVLKTLS